MWIWFLFVVLRWVWGFVGVVEDVDRDRLRWGLGRRGIFLRGLFLGVLLGVRPAMLFVTLVGR
ncbi:hypothetical protein, partial [Paenibacillus sp. Y412MC10]|uniref:hypothetical protein n=1 Tax=Geobacillus sp. (strain Y412MC10) TaxID=481743 RepID=UPI001C92FDE2